MSVSRSARMRGTSFGPLKSRLGCKTCKIRRVKCGEEKPHCVRCTSTGRKCEYESTVPISVHNNALASAPNTVWRERRAFAYYFDQAASCIGGGLDVDFWRTIVPQVCRSEPAVWDAINCVSALFESPEPCPNLAYLRQNGSPHLSQKHRDALNWYSRSVSAIRQRIDRGAVDTFVGLISCVLFICIEAMQGSEETALQLYNQGVHLILSLRAQIARGAIPATKASLIEDTIVPIFVRLGAIAITISGTSVSVLLRDTGHVSMPGFTSLKAAREAISLLAAEIQLLQLACGEHLQTSCTSQVSKELIDRQMILSSRLRSWHTGFTSLTKLLCTRDGLSQQQIGTSALLFTYHEMLHVILATCVSPLEIITDSYLPNFQNIVEQSSIALNASARSDGTQPPFNFEISVGFPLWFTCLRCREPRIRRAALALLRQAPQVLGFYKRNPAADLGERIIMLEETYGMAMTTGHVTTDSTTLESTEAPTASESHSRGHGSDIPRSDTSNLFTKPSPMLAEIADSAPTAVHIPEEARIGPWGVVRSRDGLPPEMREEDVARWNRKDQSFLRLSRNKRDLASDTWERFYEYVPIDL